jgi:hypothetical protein
MSSIFSAESEVCPLGLRGRECGHAPSANLIHSADECLRNTGLACRPMTTFEPSPPIDLDKMGSASAPSAAASRVRTSVTPALVPDCPAIDPAFGSNTPGSLANWDRMSRSWRTSQRCLIEGWEKFSERFPTSGTMQFGTIFPHVPWDTHMCDDECSLWPTPTAFMGGRGFGIPLHKNTGRYKRSTVLRVHALVNEHGWRIHPDFTEALMGFPMGWTEIEPSEMPSLRKSRKRSAAPS